MNRIALGLMLSLFSLTTANSEDAEAQKTEEHIYQAGVDFTAALASHLLVEIGKCLGTVFAILATRIWRHGCLAGFVLRLAAVIRLRLVTRVFFSIALLPGLSQRTIVTRITPRITLAARARLLRRISRLR